jgi:hypothetical protein
MKHSAKYQVYVKSPNDNESECKKLYDKLISYDADTISSDAGLKAEVSLDEASGQQTIRFTQEHAIDIISVLNGAMADSHEEPDEN